MSYKVGQNNMGRPKILLKKREIEYAISVTHSMREAASYCKVSYNTFRKQTREYGLWDPQSNKGRKLGSRGKNKFIHSILRGDMISNYRETTLLKKAIEEGYLECACGNCGANFSHMIPPMLPPLVLDFLDRDNNNGSQENLRALCLNCVYELKHNSDKAWYRHRDKPIVEILDTTEPPETSVIQQEQPALEYIPFEDFQKTLDN